MGKAFTKEQDGPGDALDEGAEVPQHQGKNYITPGGADRLKAELKKILTVDRPELVKVVQWAASNGDRSENADYQYGKRRLREFDRRIRFLTKRLEAAEIVDPLAQKAQGSDRILFGATVVAEDEEGERRTFRIVGIDETDVQRGHVSWISPVAKALLGARAGDTVTLRTPRGEEELVVLEFRYEAVS